MTTPSVTTTAQDVTLTAEQIERIGKQGVLYIAGTGEQLAVWPLCDQALASIRLRAELAIVRQQFERECQDGDKISVGLFNIPRTEGGSLQIARITNAVCDQSARLKEIETELARYQNAEMPEEPLKARIFYVHGIPGSGQLDMMGGEKVVRLFEYDAIRIHADALRNCLANVTIELENERMKVAGCSTAAIGCWKEGDSIHPDYECAAIHDVAKLYADYADLKAQIAAAEGGIDILRRIITG